MTQPDTSPAAQPHSAPHSHDRLIFLHLSDIHFHYRKSASPFDPDGDIRNELLRSIATLTHSVGRIVGILIVGDIAFSGKDAEYELAHQFIDELLTVTGSRPDRVWTVPGNHDVDRTAFQDKPSSRDLRGSFRQGSADLLNRKLLDFLDDPVANAALFDPLKAYNKFAARYGCDVNAKAPFWEQQVLQLNDGTKLAIRGITSALISDATDSSKDDRLKLVVGEFQAECRRKNDVEYLTMCHHPPSWLRDGDQVQACLSARARVQLFGHEHAQRHSQSKTSVVLNSGALQPDRSEQNWEPRFNLLSLEVETTGNHRALIVRIQALQWDRTRKLFKPDVDEDASRETAYRIALAELPAGVPTALQGPTVTSDVPPLTPITPPTAAIESVTSMDLGRQRKYRFLSLPHSVRLRIASDLALLRDEDEGITDAELWTRILTRAYESGAIEKLWKKVEEGYGNPEQTSSSPQDKA